VEVFLETTTVVDLLFKERATTEPIKAILDTYDVWYSSQYVRMEIKRGVLRHFVYLHNKAVECKTFAEVQTCISALTSTTQKNKLGTILKAIEGFFVHFERVQLSSLPNDKRPAEFLKTMLAAFLRVRIKRFWTAFDRLVDVVLDGAECYKYRFVLSPPQFDGKLFDNTLPNCDRFKPGICRLRELCRDNNAALSAIHSHLKDIENPDLETVKRISAIKEVLRLPKRDIPQKTCWRMGDAVLVLEAPSSAHILNGNCKHYDPICQAAGKIAICYRRPGRVAQP
jgi:hypothetical protein